MTRRGVINRIVTCLVLGAVTTVAASWGLALRPPVRSEWFRGPFAVGADGGGPFVWTDEDRRVGRWVRATLWQPGISGGASAAPLTGAWEQPAWGLGRAALAKRGVYEGLSATREYAYGLPLPALSFVVDAGAWPADRIAWGVPLGAYRSPRSGATTERAFPLRPIWWGLAVDTVALGAVWLLGMRYVPPLASKIVWAVVEVMQFGFSRRERRSRRGLCPECAYDLCGDLKSGCPECGWRRRGPT